MNDKCAWDIPSPKKTIVVFTAAIQFTFTELTETQAVDMGNNINKAMVNKEIYRVEHKGVYSVINGERIDGFVMKDH